MPLNAPIPMSLTDMCKAAGSPKNQNPFEWARGAGAGFIDNLVKNLNTGKSRIIKTLRGKGVAGTWAHWQVAIAYVKYLSHDFHQFVNEAFREWVEERRDPGLKIERGVDAYLKRGYTPEWVSARLKGIVHRKALAARGRGGHLFFNGPTNG